MHLLWISNTGIFYVRMKLNDPSYSRKTIEYGNLGDNEMPELKEEENKLYGKRRQKKVDEFDPDGTRTHNLRLRRPTPYPLGHRVCVGRVRFKFKYFKRPFINVNLY